VDESTSTSMIAGTGEVGAAVSILEARWGAEAARAT
jgi:hypothetical protein